MTKGRKKKPGVTRTASGRASRAKDAYQENVEPILIRMQKFGLSESDARDQKAGTFVGRLQLGKVINTSQYDAAIRYVEIVDEYRRAIAAPDGTKQAGGPTAGAGETDEYADWCSRAIGKRNAATDAVLVEQCIFVNRGTNLLAALDYLVIRDEEHWHMVGDLRLALNALAHHFGIERRVFTRAEAA